MKKPKQEVYGKRGDKYQRRKERGIVEYIAQENAKGYDLSMILDGLNGSTYTTPAMGPAPNGGKWTRTTVERLIESKTWAKVMQDAIDAHREAQKPKPRGNRAPGCGADIDKDACPGCGEGFEGYGKIIEPIKFPNTVTIEHTRKDGSVRVIEHDVTPELAEEAAKAAREERELARQYKALVDLVEHRFLDPGDMASWGVDKLGEKSWRSPLWTHGWALVNGMQDRAKGLDLAGKDSWAPVGVDSLVVELTKNSGKDAHALLDAVEPPAIKAQLRRVVHGLLKEIAFQRQRTLALAQATKRQYEQEMDLDGVWG